MSNEHEKCGALMRQASAALEATSTLLERRTKERDTARAVLRHVEWNGDEDACPDCGSWESCGHLACCALAANLPPVTS